MTEIVRSMIRFSWAMSLFGARQAGEMLSAMSTARGPRRVTRAFDSVTRTAEAELGDGWSETYHSGDRWQRLLIDTVFGAVDPAVDLSRGLASKTLLRGSLGAMRQSAELMAAAMPGAGRTVLRELGNKLEAFAHFQYADQILSVRDLSATELGEQVAAAAGNGPYLRLWLTEGLGFAFAEAAWEDGEPSGLLSGEAVENLPPECLLPLHTGMGLSLARNVLPDLAAGAPAAEEALQRFSGLCQRNARSGFTLAAYEAVGLMVRQLAPEAVNEVDRVLARESASPTHREAFWHGLGRGLYFVATQALPGSTSRAVSKIRQEAPAGAPRKNALSGLAWALTLVNFRQPEVLESFLRGQSFDGPESRAVAAGVASATRLWRDAAGEDAHFQGFRRHRPDGEAGELWTRIVTEPSDLALAEWQAVKSRSGPETIFHYRESE